MVSLRRNSTVLWMCALLHWHDPREWQQWQDRYPGSMSTTTAFVLTPVRLDLKLDLMPLEMVNKGRWLGNTSSLFPRFSFSINHCPKKKSFCEEILPTPRDSVVSPSAATGCRYSRNVRSWLGWRNVGPFCVFRLTDIAPLNMQLLYNLETLTCTPQALFSAYHVHLTSTYHALVMEDLSPTTQTENSGKHTDSPKISKKKTEPCWDCFPMTTWSQTCLSPLPGPLPSLSKVQMFSVKGRYFDQPQILYLHFTKRHFIPMKIYLLGEQIKFNTL